MVPNMKRVGAMVGKAGGGGNQKARNYDKPWLVPEKKEP